MSKLLFKNEGLRKVLALSNNARVFTRTWGEATRAYEQQLGREIKLGEDEIPAEYYISKDPTLWLVKDAGIYLMTSAKLDTQPADYSHVVYAEGFGPNVDDSYEKCREAVGGDDFCDSIPLTENIKNGIEAGFNILIDFQGDSFTIALSQSREIKPSQIGRTLKRPPGKTRNK